MLKALNQEVKIIMVKTILQCHILNCFDEGNHDDECC